MVLQSLCPPALIYFIYMTAQVIIDVTRQYYNTALMKFWMAIVMTILLNYLCQSGLGIFSWLLVSIPIILMTVIISALLYYFGMDPKTGKLKLKTQQHPTGSNYSGLAQAATIQGELQPSNEHTNRDVASSHLHTDHTNTLMYTLSKDLRTQQSEIDKLTKEQLAYQAAKSVPKKSHIAEAALKSRESHLAHHLKKSHTEQHKKHEEAHKHNEEEHKKHHEEEHKKQAAAHKEEQKKHAAAAHKEEQKKHAAAAHKEEKHPSTTTKPNCPEGWYDSYGSCFQSCPSNSQKRNASGKCICGKGGGDEKCEAGFSCVNNLCEIPATTSAHITAHRAVKPHSIIPHSNTHHLPQTLGPCPNGWINLGNNKCKNPTNVGCTPNGISTFAGFTAAQKEYWSKACGNPWTIGA
jgi:hypothetical protein